MIDKIIPKLLPQTLGEPSEEQVTSDPQGNADFGMVLPPELMMPPMGQASEAYRQMRLRTQLEDATLRILEAHTFSISYEKAWAIAETICLAQYARQAQPLSDEVLKTIQEDGSSQPPPGIPNQRTAAQAMAGASATIQ
jgi:hypothetical protein